MPKEFAITAMAGGSPLETNATSMTGRWRDAQRRIGVLCQSSGARTSFGNALFGIGDYLSQPVVMLLAAPYLLHRLGLSQYGLWMLATAAVTSASLISTGFGDATLKYASMYRGLGNREKLQDILRVNLAINLTLGGILALAIWYGTPFAVRSLFSVDVSLRAAAIAAFRIASAILLLRSVENVFIGALRAHERYGPSVRVNVLARTATVVSACVLVSQGYGIVGIMAATLCIVAGSTILQATAARMIIGPISPVRSVSRAAFSEVFGFGCYSWLQVVAGCIFNQADRLLIGILLGTSAVAYYSVCIQAAQPIHGLIAAGLNFLFPHLSARLPTMPVTAVKTVVVSILRLNVVVAGVLCAPLALFSKSILRIWMGAAFAQQAWVVLSIVAVGFGFLALNITAHYSLLALGQARLVAMLNLAGGAAMLAAMGLLAPRFGLTGAAIGRLVYGPITLLLYSALRPTLSSPGSELRSRCLPLSQS